MIQKIHSMQSHVQVSLRIFISNHSSYLPLLRIDKGSGVVSHPLGGGTVCNKMTLFISYFFASFYERSQLTKTMKL